MPDDEQDESGAFSRIAGSDRQKAGLAAFVIVVVVAAVILFMPMDAPEQPETPTPSGTNNTTDPFETYAGANESTGTTQGVSDVTVGATVTIDQYGVSPARASMKVGQAVEWHNTNGFPVRLTFDRTSQEPTIPANGTLKMRFRGITYYQVFNTDTGNRIARGSIYVE